MTQVPCLSIGDFYQLGLPSVIEAKPTTRMSNASALAPNGRLTNVPRSSSTVTAAALGRQRITLMNVVPETGVVKPGLNGGSR